MQQADGVEGGAYVGVVGYEGADVEAGEAEVFGKAVFDVEEGGGVGGGGGRG